MTVDVEQVIEMIGADTITIDGTEYKVTATNIAKYAVNKQTEVTAVLSRYRDKKGIVVEEETTKR